MEAKHCWQDEREWLFENGTPEELTESYRRGNGTCLLPFGHAGDHKFIPDSAITIEFKPDGEAYVAKK